MSFYTIENPKEREERVKEYLALKDRIKKRSMAERIGELNQQNQLNDIFSPVVKAHEETRSVIKDSMEPVKEQIQSLNENIQTSNAAAASTTTRTGTEDQYFGFVRYKDKILMGKKEIHIDDDKLKVDNVEYNLTAGLWSLITEKNPQSYTEKDLDAYSALVRQTEVIDHPNNVTSKSRPRATTKFQKILKPIMQKEQQQGTGINFLPNDINSLVQKLQLLVGEYVAGNKTTRNEIIAILDNLRGRNKIREEEYKRINTLLK